MHIFEYIGFAYVVILVLRAILSWFPPPTGEGPMTTARSVLWKITEPVLAPFRRLIPPIGGFDVSFSVAFLAILVITEYLLVKLP